MITKRSCTVLMVMIFTVIFLVASPGPVNAEEQIQTKSMIQAKEQVDGATELRLRLRNQLMKEFGLESEELEAIDPILKEALRLNGGDTEPIRKMVRKALQIDCVGECLMERLRNHNRLMLQEHKQVDENSQVASQERVTTRTRTRVGEQYGDLARTETQTQTRNQDGSGSGSQGGEGKGK